MKVAVLGAGQMGATVIKYLQDCEQVDGIIAYDIRKERIKELHHTYGIYGTLDLYEILRDEDIPLVFVTAPNNLHRDFSIKSLRAGKSVMCEKPMATNLADAKEMVETAERLNAFLQIGFELRYSKLYMKVKEWIDEDLLGEVINTHCPEISESGSDFREDNNGKKNFYYYGLVNVCFRCCKISFSIC